MTKKNKVKSGRSQAFIQAFAILGIVLAINIIANIYFARIDLTADKRYTISKPTKNLIHSLDDVVYIKIYLTGKDLPPGFRNLSESTKELLDEFRQIGGKKIQYSFINPDAMPDASSRQNLYKELSSQGLSPVTLTVNETDKVSEKLIFPGAIVTYNNKSTPVVLLQQQLGDIPPDQILHNSVVGLEYQFANAIRKLKIIDRSKIAFIKGHGELSAMETNDIANALSEYYQVDYVDLPKYKVGRLDDYKVIIIAKPDSAFSELEKYKIDQYIMSGGKVLWCIDPLFASMDSLQTNPVTYTYDYKLNLIEDFLFKYGVRLNYNLVQDLNCNYIPVIAPYGQVMRKDLKKWPYFPVVPAASSHPIVKGINAVWFRFASSIDTINSRSSANVEKTILLQSSPYTRVMLNPVKIDRSLISMLQRETLLYRQGPQTLAVLLEGSFESAFSSRRPSPETLASGDYGVFSDKSKPTKMIVISDGDVIKNDIVKSKNEILPLGYDRYTSQTFGNKTFILNCIDYLIDEDGLISVRSKDIKMRLLNNTRVKNEKFNWQMLNIVLPLVALIIFGLIFNYVRKRRFA